MNNNNSSINNPSNVNKPTNTTTPINVSTKINNNRLIREHAMQIQAKHKEKLLNNYVKQHLLSNSNIIKYNNPKQPISKLKSLNIDNHYIPILKTQNIDSIPAEKKHLKNMYVVKNPKPIIQLNEDVLIKMSEDVLIKTNEEQISEKKLKKIVFNDILINDVN
jgi:hypothetical protein